MNWPKCTACLRQYPHEHGRDGRIIRVSQVSKKKEPYLTEEAAWAKFVEMKRVSQGTDLKDLREENERIRNEMTRMAAALGVLKGRYGRLSRLTRTILIREPVNRIDYDYALDELRAILTADEAGEQND